MTIAEAIEIAECEVGGRAVTAELVDCPEDDPHHKGNHQDERKDERKDPQHHDGQRKDKQRKDEHKDPHQKEGKKVWVVEVECDHTLTTVFIDRETGCVLGTEQEQDDHHGDHGKQGDHGDHEGKGGHGRPMVTA
ncbi:PepSY domain-containing protein OS=Streptomyces antimycoticus OX=68175 GN=SSPO_046360 PE=4 SV=1 [Streptomyces antimycoticus]